MKFDANKRVLKLFNFFSFFSCILKIKFIFATSNEIFKYWKKEKEIVFYE
jgi:hypothetical protein